MIIKDKSEGYKVRVEEIQRGACFKQLKDDEWFYYMMIEQYLDALTTRRVVNLDFGTLTTFDSTEEVIPIDIEGVIK